MEDLARAMAAARENDRRVEVRALLNRSTMLRLKARALAESARTGRAVGWQDLLRDAADRAAGGLGTPDDGSRSSPPAGPPPPPTPPADPLENARNAPEGRGRGCPGRADAPAPPGVPRAAPTVTPGRPYSPARPFRLREPRQPCLLLRGWDGELSVREDHWQAALALAEEYEWPRERGDTERQLSASRAGALGDALENAAERVPAEDDPREVIEAMEFPYDAFAGRDKEALRRLIAFCRRSQGFEVTEHPE